MEDFKEAVWSFPGTYPGEQDSTSKDLLEQSQALHTLNPSLILPLKSDWFKTVPPPVELSECWQGSPSYSGGQMATKGSVSLLAQTLDWAQQPPGLRPEIRKGLSP